MKARHRKSTHGIARALAGITATVASTVGLVGASAGTAHAITRCVGAVDVPGAFACYTSPMFKNSGLDKTNVAEFPVVCWGVTVNGTACTGDELWILLPGENVSGQFTSVFYLGHTYTVYRPAMSQPYIVTSDNPRLDAATQAQVMLLSTALDAANAG